MLYREAGQYKTTYAADMAIFPLREDRIGLALIIAFAYLLAFIGNGFLLQAVLIPFLVFSLAAMGLNILVGYAGLLSLGTGAFMGVGAYASYKLMSAFPNVNVIIWILASGFFSEAAGVLFGLPSLRIKGFYLAVATLAAQFFLQWCFIRVPWLVNYNASGALESPLRTLFGVPIMGATATPQTRYLVVLTLVIALTWIASNLVHGRIGRMWMAVRDMDIAAELIGIRLLRTKLLAFAVSSYYCGVAGALLVFLWYGGAEYDVFDINQSFIILFMVIIGATATPQTRYLVVLTLVIALTWLASNLVHGRIGRMWMAVRDMDIAAELIGIRLLRTKLLAFAVSSYYCGVAGALLVFLWYGGAEYDVFDINQSFIILFMVIIGGLGSLIGSFFGAALIFIMPIVLGIVVPAVLSPFGLRIGADVIEHLRFMLVGVLIIAFLIAEPHGLARLWQIAKQKLRVWPFPY